MTLAPDLSSQKKSPPAGGQSILCLAVLPQAGVGTADRPYNFPLYWIEVKPSPTLIDTLAAVLADPLLEQLWCIEPGERYRWAENWSQAGFRFWAERQYLPGVTDNLGKTVEEALRLSGIQNCRVASGQGLLFPSRMSQAFDSVESVEQYCRYRHYHPLTDRLLVHDLQKDLGSQRYLSMPQVHLSQPAAVQAVPLDLDDAGLQKLSRDRVLALTLEEMQAIRDYFRQPEVQKSRSQTGMPSWPTDVELEILAQTWSEHCKHKIFNATIQHQDTATGQHKTITSLYKTYIQAPTEQLRSKRTDLLSVFEDNAGVVQWNDRFAVCFKVETHNSPSALEPYGGALTGILGVNRDILGTGLGAKPIFNTDVFCFAYPSADLPSRPTLLPAEAIIQGVRQGVQDGGNKSGIPTVNGAIYFHPGYRAKPLVYCGTGGLLPLQIKGRIGHKKYTQPGDTIVMAGGRVGKDGIHGATFSSEALHEDSPASAVQIGDPFTQKRLLDFVLEARDAGLITGITDNGAGGLSSSAGEMAQLTGGATVELENIPLKYPGLADYEIVISESQERMTLSTSNFPELQRLAEKHSLEVTAIGSFHRQGYFEITRHGQPVARLDLQFLHQGAPKLELCSEWLPVVPDNNLGPPPANLGQELLNLLAHPNICSREAIIRQYDHEVQGSSLVKPLMGPQQTAPCDAAVIKPVLNEEAGLAVSNGLCPQLSQWDTYLMAICAADEAVRNAVCVGADPATISLLDNFCWPDPVESKRNPDGKKKLAQLVRACQGLKDAVMAFQAPLISGKDSMKNDFDDGTIRLSIPPTLLVSAIGRVPDTQSIVTMEFKTPGDLVYLLSAGTLSLTGSQYALSRGWTSSELPELDLKQAAALYRRLHQAIRLGWVKSCHDLSEGGLAVALAECVIGSALGVDIKMQQVYKAVQQTQTKIERADQALFAEGPGHLVVSLAPDKQAKWEEHWQGFSCFLIGAVSDSGLLRIQGIGPMESLQIDSATLKDHWSTALPLEGREEING